MEWVEKSKDKHHIYGPEDVYAVAKKMLELPFINKDKLFLRGCSFGSHINAHLLADVKKGKFEPIFKGAHREGSPEVALCLTGEIPHDVRNDVNRPA